MKDLRGFEQFVDVQDGDQKHRVHLRTDFNTLVNLETVGEGGGTNAATLNTVWAMHLSYYQRRMSDPMFSKAFLGSLIGLNIEGFSGAIANAFGADDEPADEAPNEAA